MFPFTILSLREYTTTKEVELTIRSFSELYHRVTNKHKKKMKLVLIDRGGDLVELNTLINKYEINDAVKIVQPSTFVKIKETFQNASILILPTLRKAINIVPDALSSGLPILSFDGTVQRQYIDNTCGLLVQPQSPEENVDAFSSFMSMLYFDPEARKMLKKGATNKFKSIYPIISKYSVGEPVIN